MLCYVVGRRCQIRHGKGVLTLSLETSLAHWNSPSPLFRVAVGRLPDKVHDHALQCYTSVFSAWPCCPWSLQTRCQAFLHEKGTIM